MLLIPAHHKAPTGSGSTGTVNTTQMNDFSTSGTGNYTFGRTSAFGNDNSNTQFVDVDGILTTSIIATGASWNYSTANSKPASWPNTVVAGVSIATWREYCNTKRFE